MPSALCWMERGTATHWRTIAARVETGPLQNGGGGADGGSNAAALPIGWRDRLGRVRTINQDSLLERTEVGLVGRGGRPRRAQR
jgi:hypothetical protein